MMAVLSRSNRMPPVYAAHVQHWVAADRMLPRLFPLLERHASDVLCPTRLSNLQASYFHAVNAMFPGISPVRVMACQPPRAEGGTGWQIDAEYPRLSPVAASAEGATGSAEAESSSKRYKGTQTVSRKTDLGDSIMTAITVAPLSAVPFEFVGLGVLRKQECERVHALRDELTKCRAKVVESGDTLSISPSPAASLGEATICT